jgi:hypothetical protein
MAEALYCPRRKTMTRFLRNAFIFSLFFYLVSTACTRLQDFGGYLSLFYKQIYSIPFDAFPLKYLQIEGKERISIQIGTLSASEIAELLKTNPDQFPNCHEGITLKPIHSLTSKRDYVVLRFKDHSGAHWGDIKCYFSCFPYPLVQFVSLPYQMTAYYNVILPYSEFLEKNPQNPCAITLRWKNFWGHS